MWCFALEWVTEIRRHTVHDIAALNERTPFEHYMGHTPNIAALCTYSFYDYCWYWDSEQGFPDQQRVLGRSRPELDQSKELEQEQATYLAGLIGLLRWCNELGRIDIIVEVSLLSRFLACPREGHMQQAFHVFGYLKKHARSRMVFDETEPAIDQSRFRVVDWSEFYPDAAEAIPQDAPELRGVSVVTSCFVDSDHAGCRLTRRSHTGVIIFVNNAPILWHSKRQNTVESSTFGSEFVALRMAVDMIEFSGTS
jgi:hypothetical protein